MSVKRLFYLMCIIGCLCGLLILQSVKESKNETVTIKRKNVEQQLMIEGEIPEKTTEWEFCVVGDESKELYKDIFSNVCRIMEDIHVSWRMAEQITEEDMENTSTVFVFCDDVIHKYVDLQQLASFVENGGKIVAAAGLAEGYEDSYLQPVLGIVEKTIKENYNKFHFCENLLPLQSEEMEYTGYNVSTWISLRDKTNVLLETTEKKVPIIYTSSFGEGECLVVNGTLLSDFNCIGILTGSLGEMLEPFVYPVLGVKSIFLDNFPMVTYINDPVCMKLYGRTTEGFVRDVVWPVFQNIAVTDQVVYTSSVLSVSNRDSFPEINSDLFKTLGKSALQFDGEFVYAANIFSEEKEEELYRNEKFIDGFEKVFTNYDISGMVMMSEEGEIREVIHALDKEVLAVRGNLNAENEEERICFTEDFFVFPKVTEGFESSDGDWLDIKSVLAAYGMLSHTFDVNNLISSNEEEAKWDQDKILLSEFEKDILQETQFLNPVTLSETQYIVKSYLGLDYGYNCEENELHLYADNFVQGQTFYVRTEKEIEEAVGADFEKISEGYYMVKLKMPEAVFTLNVRE